jgi:hypothetical protein
MFNKIIKCMGKENLKVEVRFKRNRNPDRLNNGLK